MNTEALIEEMAMVLKDKSEAKAALKSLIANLTTALKKGEDVKLAGFGSFKTVQRKARTGRNPRTGEAIKIKASRVVRFVPGKALKDAVN